MTGEEHSIARNNLAGLEKHNITHDNILHYGIRGVAQEFEVQAGDCDFGGVVIATPLTHKRKSIV